jgi:sigma-B regulation protein RsbU (phosphoserine phosphatase)
MQDDITRLEQENKRLKAAVRELAALNEISRVINSTMTVEEISRQIMKKVVNVVQAAEAAVHTFTDDSTQLSPHTFVRGKLDSSSLAKAKLDIRVAGWVARNKKPLLVNDLAVDERFKNVELTDSPVKSLLAVPLTVKGKLIGELTVFNSHKPAGFTDDDVRLLGIIGVQAAQIIENARLYREELKLRQLEGEVQAARKIQVGFLPKTIPEIKRNDIYGATTSARETSGDYFDFIRTGDNRLIFTLGDVSGKGLPAAMLMSTIQGQARLLFNRYPDMTPANALTELNLITCQLSASDQFATMVIGSLGSDSGEITLANGGHNYPVVVRSGGDIEDISESAMLIGMFDGAKFANTSFTLNAGDFVAIFSDGIEEAFNADGEEFGITRLKEHLLNVRDKDARTIYETAIGAVAEFRGEAEQSDDLTLMIIKRKE